MNMVGRLIWIAVSARANRKTTQVEEDDFKGGIPARVTNPSGVITIYCCPFHCVLLVSLREPLVHQMT